MIKIIKDAVVYAPEYIGVSDILIVGGTIACIDRDIKIEKNPFLDIEIIDGKNKIAVPGFIDSHVHILGGGGEGGYRTRTPEIKLSDITASGVTTLVGCLGTDGITRSVESLLAKANALDDEGISTYIYTGSYRIPITTITGDVMKDIMTIDKIIGVGEIALSDHRSSQPTYEEIKHLAADARVGGILSKKSGIINVHMGDGKDKLKYLFELANSSEIPITQFLPTHMTRNMELFKEGVKYALAGGYIDFTTSTSSISNDEKLTPSKALKMCLEEGVAYKNISFSSDGQGSLPVFNREGKFLGLGVGSVSSLYNEVKKAVLNYDVPLDIALSVITSNPAEILKLTGKGKLEKGFDADIVILDSGSLEIDSVIAKGQIMVKNKRIIVKGTFE